MFSTFPDGWPGLGLLLLRGAAGMVLVARCVAYLAAGHDLRLMILAALFVTFASAVFLLMGYQTRAAAAIAAVASISSMFFWLSIYPLHGNRLSSALVGIIAAAVICLGPGAFSLDSRLFGRREIIIPRPGDEA
jgi:putative oxidoreductase